MPRTKWFNIVAGIASIFVILNALSCSSRPGPPATAAPPAAALGGRTFSVVLFPYIPDSGGDNFASLIASLESQFEAANPEIDLQITMDLNMNLYDFELLKTLLGTDDGSVDMVEVDTILLGDLVSRNLVQSLPFKVTDLGLLPAALAAAKVNATHYGVPTYLCGNYIYSWEAGIRQVSGGQELIDFLNQHPQGTLALVGNFKGSWTLPALYVDAWADTYTNDPSRVARSYDLPLDSRTMDIFSSVVNLCGPKGGPCLEGAYKDNTMAEAVFAKENAKGFVGYSERLFYILQERGGDSVLPSVISAPLGEGSDPEIFVDALVLNRACTDQCATDAETFSRFMSSLQVRNLIAFSQDVPSKALPRYLLQALMSFYQSPPANENPVYWQLAPFVRMSRAIPNDHFPESRYKLESALNQRLHQGDH